MRIMRWGSGTRITSDDLCDAVDIKSLGVPWLWWNVGAGSRERFRVKLMLFKFGMAGGEAESFWAKTLKAVRGRLKRFDPEYEFPPRIRGGYALRMVFKINRVMED